ncbi:MAG: hypothetical protein ACI9DS_001586 [Glaciecola sp.]|jgi:hypothetical protein
MKLAYKAFLSFILVISGGLMLLNIYGLTQDLRPKNLTADVLRFGERDVQLSKDDFFKLIEKNHQESSIEYAKRVTRVIADGTAHLEWESHDPVSFHQLVPAWENWIIFLMGKYSGIPEYERYHFSNPYKSIERGIGICGDASIVMSQMLEKNGIEAQILTFPGHVVVTANIDTQQFIFDADFGVVIPSSAEQLNKDVGVLRGLYSSQGHPESDDRFFEYTYSKEFKVWEGPEHFITKKFYFEKFAYVAKWIVPLFGLITFFVFIRKR